MFKRFIGPKAFVVAACAWWLGTTMIYLIATEPGPFDPIQLFNWDRVELVYGLAPLITVPFIALGLWVLATCLRHPSRLPPIWMTWACGAAALSWFAFAAWQAHEQVRLCMLLAPRNVLGTPSCSLPYLLLGRAGWLGLPLAVWLFLAAIRVPSSAVRMRSSHPAL